MATRSDSVWNGWRLTGVTIAALIAMAAITAALSSGAAEAARMVIRLTARTSLMLFLMVFSASALARLAPNPTTLWLRANRRYLGVSFAASHAIHAVAIAALYRIDPLLFASLTNLGSFIGGGLGYVFIVLMTVTSFDRTAAAIGPKAWRILHTSGIWYLWLSFMLNFGKRIPTSGLYVLPIALLLAVFVLRLVARKRSLSRT